MDLRAEPIVVTLPEIDRDRYYSLQLVDLYTNNSITSEPEKTGTEAVPS
jgi:hypothetical protein